MNDYKPKHNILYYLFEINQDIVNFLRAEGRYKQEGVKGDEQVYSHYGQTLNHSDKYVGIIIELHDNLYFAPLTHDGDKKWFVREDMCDFELVYDRNNKYTGSLLLCKALPLTTNLVKRLKISSIAKKEGTSYADLCADELRYLNSTKIHQNIQVKLRDCIYGKESSCMQYRVKYNEIAKRVKEYNRLKQQEHSYTQSNINE